MNGTRYKGASKGDKPGTSIEVIELTGILSKSYRIHEDGHNYLEDMKRRQIITNYKIALYDFCRLDLIIDVSEDLNIDLTIFEHNSKICISCYISNKISIIGALNSIKTYEELEDYIVKFRKS
jgi:hypothetical protein